MKGGTPHRGVNRVWQREGRMIVGESQEVREQVSRWIEDGQNHYLGAVSRVLQDYDRLQGAVESAEHESEQLREEVKQLRAGTERHLREREEIADALTRVMNEAITRLRTQAA